MDILHDFTPSSIQAAIDANEIAYGRFLARQPGGIWHHDSGLSWFETRHQLNLFNGVLYTYLTPDILPTEIDRIRAHFEQRHLPFHWRIGPSSQPSNLKDCLQACGCCKRGSSPPRVTGRENIWIFMGKPQVRRREASPHRERVSATHRVDEAFLAQFLPYRCCRSTD